VADSSISLIVVGCKNDLPLTIDTTLIKMINTWAEEEVTTSAKTGDRCEEALSLMIR
jgi:hypothetical protein